MAAWPRGMVLTGLIAILLTLTAVLGTSRTPDTPAPLPAADTTSEGYLWRPVAIGGGGFVTGLAASLDGRALIVRTDVHGAYRWDAAADRWRQLVTADTMPTADRAPDRADAGVYAIAVAPTDSRRLYMALKGRLYASRDGGAHWAQGTAPAFDFDANGPGRFAGPFLAVSRSNPDRVLFASPVQGLWRSDDGGSSWRRLSLPVPATGAPPGITIRFGPSGAARDVPLLVSVAGSGVFQSLDGGDHFAALTAGDAPRAVWRADFFPDGAMIAVDRDGQQVHVLRGGRWRALAGVGGLPRAPFVGVAVDRAGRRAIVSDEGGKAWCSIDGGHKWSAMRRSIRPGLGDPPWLRVADQEYFATGSIHFDPQNADRLWAATGTGPYVTQVDPGCTTLAWESQVRGIEELVAMDVIHPPGQAPLFAALDFGIHRKPDLDRYSDSYGPRARVLIAAQQLDWSPAQPGFVVTNASDTRTDCCWQDGQAVLAGYSEDGGGNWQRFATLPVPPGTRADDPWRMAFGTIAVSADSPDTIVWAPAYDRSPYYTRDRGRSWARVELPGERLPETGSFGSIWFQRKTLAADRVLPGTFYLYHSGNLRNRDLGGLWATSDGGSRWRRQFAGAIAPQSDHAAKLRAVPGYAGHLFFTTGVHGGPDSALRRSRDGGMHWAVIRDVTDVDDVAFGKAAAGASYPAIYLSGRVQGRFGLWRSVDGGVRWLRLAEFALGRLDRVTVLGADPDRFGRVYVGYQGSGWIYGDPADCGPSQPAGGEVQCQPTG